MRGGAGSTSGAWATVVTAQGLLRARIAGEGSGLPEHDATDWVWLAGTLVARPASPRDLVLPGPWQQPHLPRGPPAEALPLSHAVARGVRSTVTSRSCALGARKIRLNPAVRLSLGQHPGGHARKQTAELQNSWRAEPAHTCAPASPAGTCTLRKWLPAAFPGGFPVRGGNQLPSPEGAAA